MEIMTNGRRRLRTAVFGTLAALTPLGAAAEEGIAPLDQETLNAMVRDGRAQEAFEHAFEAGDELSEFSFRAEHGVGANIGENRRFTRFPRADLSGPTEWANHFPKREGGANATRCIACHNSPVANGAGDIAMNVVVDPAHTGDPALYLERNTPPIVALGVTQRLAEEISMALYRQRDAAIRRACSDGVADTELTAKGIDYGRLRITRIRQHPCAVDIDDSGVDGIDNDLVVRAFGWKGNHATIRAFTRGAAHNELGLQAVEIVGREDGDFDGVTSELSVGDVTALTVYMAALERPVTRRELTRLGLDKLDALDIAKIAAGEEVFAAAQCTRCHIPRLEIDHPVFQEPSATPGFYDQPFPDGSSPEAHGLLLSTAIRIDLTRDPPNNRIVRDDGEVILLGALSRGRGGHVWAPWYTDFKRHDMGADLADPADPLGLGAAVFMTRSLAGVGSTGPWLHDGRATSLHEAILMHGGDAAESRDAYLDAGVEERSALIAFLQDLVLFKQE